MVNARLGQCRLRGATCIESVLFTNFSVVSNEANEIVWVAQIHQSIRLELARISFQGPAGNLFLDVISDLDHEAAWLARHRCQNTEVFRSEGAAVIAPEIMLHVHLKACGGFSLGDDFSSGHADAPRQSRGDDHGLTFSF